MKSASETDTAGAIARPRAKKPGIVNWHRALPLVVNILIWIAIIAGVVVWWKARHPH